MNKLFIIILITTSLLTCIFSFNPTKVNADSGFDTSYDGGSSWSDYDSDWSSSDSGEPVTTEELIISLIIVGTIFLLPLISYIFEKIIPERKKKREKRYAQINTLTINKNNYDENIIKKYIPDFNKNKFLDDRYNDYLKVQEDWMNFNYDGLKENLTDELYNQYEMQLDTLKIKNQKNVMKDFNLIDSDITNITEENGTIIVDLEMVVAFIDYIEQNGKAVRGNKNIKVYQHYSMTFIMKPETIEKCPNCGGKLDSSSAQICSYCRSKITRLGSKWVLSKKESLKQK